MPVAIIGAGEVGATLGQAWLKHGQDVIWGLGHAPDQPSQRCARRDSAQPAARRVVPSSLPASWACGAYRLRELGAQTMGLISCPVSS